jgi:hypothetical protein
MGINTLQGQTYSLLWDPESNTWQVASYVPQPRLGLSVLVVTDDGVELVVRYR